MSQICLLPRRRCKSLPCAAARLSTSINRHAVQKRYKEKHCRKCVATASVKNGYDLFIGRSDDQQIIATENVDGNISVSIKVLYSISSSSWKVVSYENNTENNTDEDNNGNVDNDLDDDIELDINSLGNELGGEFGTADDDNKNCELLYIYSLYIKFELSLTLVSLSIAKHRARTPFRGIVVFCATT